MHARKATQLTELAQMLDAVCCHRQPWRVRVRCWLTLPWLATAPGTPGLCMSPTSSTSSKAGDTRLNATT